MGIDDGWMDGWMDDSNFPFFFLLLVLLFEDFNYNIKEKKWNKNNKDKTENIL